MVPVAFVINYFVVKYFVVSTLGYIKAYIENIELDIMQKLNLKFIYEHNSLVVVHSAIGILAVVNKADKCLKYCIRTINTSSGKNPIITYLYPDKEKNIIITENRGQSGVYR